MKSHSGSTASASPGLTGIPQCVGCRVSITRMLRGCYSFQRGKAGWILQPALHLRDERFENMDKIQPLLIRIKSSAAILEVRCIFESKNLSHPVQISDLSNEEFDLGCRNSLG